MGHQWAPLLSYVALFGVALSLAMLARRRVVAAPPERPGQALPVLDPYEIAYLNGGDALVATTAAANRHRPCPRPRRTLAVGPPRLRTVPLAGWATVV
jgi:uncharacterized protein (TIGR04222 family)